MKRITKFNEKIWSKVNSPTFTKPLLSTEVLTQTDISPASSEPSLAIEILPQIDISPLRKILSSVPYFPSVQFHTS